MLTLTHIKLFLIALITLTIIDFIWIGVIFANSYRKTIESVQKTKFIVRIVAGLIVYIALALIIVFWVIPRIQLESKKNLLLSSFIYGGLLGGLIYAVFDFTNHAIFTNWDLQTSIIDTIWGTILMTIISFITAYSNKYLL
jgi:hypothetical protein